MVTPAGVETIVTSRGDCFLFIQRRIIKGLRFKGCEQTIGFLFFFFFFIFFHSNGSRKVIRLCVYRIAVSSGGHEEVIYNFTILIL